MQSDENKALDMPPYLFISGEGLEPATMPLERNNSLFVGSGSNCRILLRGRDIDPIHCMFWINDDCVLRIQDWNTGGKTVVNGQSVTAETVLSSGDKVEICDYLIVPVLSQEDHQLIAGRLGYSHPATVSASDQPPTESQMHADKLDASSRCNVDDSAFPAETQTEPIKIDAVAVEPPSPEPADSAPVCDRASELEEECVWDQEYSDRLELEAGPFFDMQELSSSQAIDDSRVEEVELLRMEVEQLRFELAQRDAHPQFDGNALGTQVVWETEPNPVDDDQTVQLVNRLEDLLEELQSSDERVRGLEELLQFSDQAAQAEQEERQQLESWVTEIEQRVSQREAESDAEISRVMDRLKEAQTQYRHVEVQLKQVLQSKGTKLADASKELIQKSREQIHDLQQRLESANHENERLRRQVQCNEGEVKAREELLQMEQKLMEVEVKSSRERAELARQRAELENLKDELEHKLNSSKVVDNADSRVEAMRQHLRDIHEEEKIALEEKRQRSLSGRISRLLNRVGR
jgi:hypothetical protein